ncbi:uncharacterized protein LOC113508141 [Trichoplusia ni]|uniref:Uncharacterized protein LOC113508141 n=1 Tax=Trichoplusia ni TaxID=7111 RepID=A0A7E5X399_TRINI|nr:uncharacterized protein LOC113508141 [Trichoplusia ni]
MDNASMRLKCASCNIVISEVLAFIQNKQDVMDEQSLVQICSSAFSAADIKLAKSLLFESLSKRPTERKRHGKTLRDLEDIICIFKETDPEKIPIFVARTLEKLPPVTFDHIDVTVLLKKIVLLEKNVQNFKQLYATKTELNDRINECNKTSSFINQELNVNTRRGGGSFKLFDSGPMALPTVCGDEAVVERNITARYPSLSPVQQPPPASSPTSVSEHQARVNETTNKCISTTDKEDCERLHSYTAPQLPATINETADRGKQIDGVTEKRPLFSEVMQKDDKLNMLEDNDEWTLVQKRRNRNLFLSQRGSAVIDSANQNLQFRAADIKVPLFISNVHKAVSEQAIVNYVYEKTQERVTLVKIKMKKEKPYNAYKLFVTKHKIDTFLDEKLWPSGVSFRRFVHFHMRRKNKDENIDINNGQSQ